MSDKKKNGRPKIDVDFEQIDALCAVFCNCKEIMAVIDAFGVKLSYDTVERRIKEQFDVTFAEYVKQKQMAFAKPKLRKAQLECALKGNPTMLIWLGKQYLDQVDKQEHEITGADGGPIDVNAIIRKAEEEFANEQRNAGEDSQ
jgi:AraC-like DNA-binding protein